MSRVLLVAFVLGIATTFAVESPERTAQTAAESWLALVDSGKASESWQALARPSRQAISEWRWKLGFSLSQRKFGSFSGRVLRSTGFATKSPSGRTGEYVFLEFQSTSPKRGAVIEKLATIHEPDGQWRVVTYTVE
jgi:hypothetical protein